MIQKNLKAIANEIGFLGWTITLIKNNPNELELLIIPKYEADFRPIDENDTMEKSIKRYGLELFNLGQINNILQSFGEYEFLYTGRIKVFTWKSINQKQDKLQYAPETALEMFEKMEVIKLLSKGYFINEIYFDETCNNYFIN